METFGRGANPPSTELRTATSSETHAWVSPRQFHQPTSICEIQLCHGRVYQNRWRLSDCLGGLAVFVASKRMSRIRSRHATSEAPDRPFAAESSAVDGFCGAPAG